MDSVKKLVYLAQHDLTKYASPDVMCGAFVIAPRVCGAFQTLLVLGRITAARDVELLPQSAQ